MMTTCLERFWESWYPYMEEKIGSSGIGIVGEFINLRMVIE